jgi:predicted metalloprotease with PDZ domain
MIVKYEIDFKDALKNIYQLKLRFKAITGQVTLSLPSWIPGSYMIRNFAKNIVWVEAKDVNKNEFIPVKPLDKDSFFISCQADDELEVSYQVYAFDGSVRSAYLDSERAFFNGTSLFLKVHGSEKAKHELTLKPGLKFDKFRVATGMPRATGTEKYNFGTYFANSYQEFIDYPFEIGTFTSFEFKLADINYHMIISGKNYADLEALRAHLSKICNEHNQFWTEVPFKEYWFLTKVSPNSYGGLEHRNSTALICSTFDISGDLNDDSYLTFLGLCSHEYFHAWNVCRLKPAEFKNLDLQRENYTTQLWFYEGITSYYDDLALYNTKLIDREKYLKILNKTLSRVDRGAGQLKQSLLESSFYTWTKFYLQGADALNNITSYYTKGALCALWLDLKIRFKSEFKFSLKDLMRKLWHEQRAEGTSLKGVMVELEEMVDGELAYELSILLAAPDSIYFEKVFSDFGLKEHKHQADLESAFNKNSNTKLEHKTLGFTYAQQADGYLIKTVLEGSPAAKAGLYPGDLLVACDNLQLSKNKLTKILENLSVTDKVSFSLFRNQELKHIELEFNAKQYNYISELEIVNLDKLAKWLIHQ